MRPPTGRELGIGLALAGSSLACSIFGLVQVAIYLSCSTKGHADVAVVFSLLGLALAIAFLFYNPWRDQ